MMPRPSSAWADSKVVWVFAEEDTDGEPLPTLTSAAATGGEELLPQLEAAAQKLLIQLDYEELAEAGVQGYSEGGRIVIRKSLEIPAKLRSFFMSNLKRKRPPMSACATLELNM